MNFGKVSANSFLAVCFCARLLNQEPQEVRLDTIEKLELQNLKADIVSYLGRAAVHIENTGPRDSGYGDGLAIVRGLSLQDGTIEVTLSGDTAPDAPTQLRGFVRISSAFTSGPRMDDRKISCRGTIRPNTSRFPGSHGISSAVKIQANTSRMSTSSPDSGPNSRSRLREGLPGYTSMEHGNQR